MAVADFNGDGNLDIAVGAYNGNVTIFLGNGNGTFSAAPSTLSVGTDPTSIVVADFNHDGKPDLAVSCVYSNTVSVFLGNGDGTFTSPSSPTASGSYAGLLAPIDMNGDGFVDLLVSSPYGTNASVLLSNGDGTFTAGSSFTLPASPGGTVTGRLTSSGFPAVIATFSSLDEVIAFEPYIAQSATGNVTGFNPIGPGSNLVVANYGGGGIYSGSQSNTLNLQGKNQSILNWAYPASIVYGTALGGSQLDATANVPGTFVYSPAAGTVLTVGSQPLFVTFTPTDTTDYTTAIGMVLLQVTQATPTITWANPASIGYGTALSATQLNATANTPGSFAYSPVTGVLPSAGTQTLSVTFTPTDSIDYTNATATAQLTVNKAALTVTANNASMTYGGTVPTLAGTLTGVVGSDGITASFATTATSSTPAGTYPITATLNDPNSKLGNYAVTNNSGTLTISQVTPSISWSAPSATTYGTPLSAAQLNASSTVAGTWTYSPALGAVLPAGNQTLTVTFTPTDATDYATTRQSVQLTINKAPLTLTANNASMAYGGTVPTLSGTLTGVIAGDGITASYATTATSSSAVGTYPITATLNDPNSRLVNYAVTNNSGTLTIGLTTPAITWATPAAITYGTPLSSVQLNAGSTVAGTWTYSPALGAVLPAGNQALTVTFTPTDATDYATTRQSVQLTVNKAPLSVTVNNQSMAYGGTVPPLTGTLS